VLTAPGRNYFTAVEMAMQAPFVDAAASIDPHNRSNTFISYYTYGAAIALGLDLALRTEHEHVTLDDFMRAMWARYGRTEMPYTLENWRLTLGQVVRNQEWADSFYYKHVAGKEPIDFAKLLGRAGLLLRKAGAGQATMGAAAFTRDTGRVVLANNTLVGSPLYTVGVDRGDRIVSIDNTPMTSAADVQTVLQGKKPGDRVAITWESRGQTRTATMTLAERDQLEIVPYESAGMAVTDEMKALRAAWLGSKVR
jgi:predicted metalloprotease with PDZ domain